MIDCRKELRDLVQKLSCVCCAADIPCRHHASCDSRATTGVRPLQGMRQAAEVCDQHPGPADRADIPNDQMPVRRKNLDCFTRRGSPSWTGQCSSGSTLELVF